MKKTGRIARSNRRGSSPRGPSWSTLGRIQILAATRRQSSILRLYGVSRTNVRIQLWGDEATEFMRASEMFAPVARKRHCSRGSWAMEGAPDLVRSEDILDATSIARRTSADWEDSAGCAVWILRSRSANCLARSSADMKGTSPMALRPANREHYTGWRPGATRSTIDREMQRVIVQEGASHATT